MVHLPPSNPNESYDLINGGVTGVDLDIFIFCQTFSVFSFVYVSVFDFNLLLLDETCHGSLFFGRKTVKTLFSDKIERFNSFRLHKLKKTTDEF
jgi:hypothetical protein